MLTDVGSCCGNTDKINSLSPDFLVAYFTHTLHILYTYFTHTLHTHIIVEKSLMIWPDVVFAFHESHHQARHSGHFPIVEFFNRPSFSAEQLPFICILIELSPWVCKPFQVLGNFCNYVVFEADPLICKVVSVNLKCPQLLAQKMLMAQLVTNCQRNCAHFCTFLSTAFLIFT